MTIRGIQEFISCEQGGGTVMGLFWFILFVGFGGLAVDITNGFRHKTMLQASADSAALASVIDLPDESAAVTTAIVFSKDNMPTQEYGNILNAGDVETGLWDDSTRTFSTSGFPAGTILNAVRVTVDQSVANNNAVTTNFLRMIGLWSWDVRAQAVAQAFNPMCLRGGLTARQKVQITSNNGFVKEICVHGQQGVEMNNNNYFEPGTEVSMPDLSDLTTPASGMGSNPGLQEALTEINKEPRLVNQVDQIMADFLDPSSGLHPSYIDTSQPVIEVNQGFQLDLVEPGRVYHVTCPPNVLAKIPAGAVINQVVIITDCGLQIGAGALVTDSVLGSRSGGGNAGPNKAIIQVPAGAQLGLADNCAPGGGVQLFSNATMQFASSTGIDGVQMVAAGDIELGALATGINGISAQAGGNISMTANNEFGLCQGGVPMLRRYFYWRLVQ
ncbi:MAG: pilus assembly protein TadG-related protein [Paracoccaceae bacterium]|nr:pilus assembly protein TadG-related protein [Paracoccaceae bacterium]